MAVFLTAIRLGALPGIQHGFFTRRGGVSASPYDALNCGHGSKDNRGAVTENRALVAARLGVAPERLLTVHQVHGAAALAVTGPWSDLEHRPQADALVTSTRGLVLGALTADCAPVLFADAKAGVIGAAHAGWKGALAGILESTISAMQALGAEPSRIHAAIGPTIGRDHYEVGDEFRQTFLAHSVDYARFFHLPAAGAKPHFDLPGFAAARLRAAGIGHLEDLARCTYAGESDFYSYRRATHKGQADYGRQISAIVLD